MKTPYQCIGEANHVAFLSNSEGYDLAVLKPVTVDQPDLGPAHHMTNIRWQHMINLVGAAPAMLQHMENARNIIWSAMANGAFDRESDDEHDSRDEVMSVLSGIDETLRAVNSPRTTN